MEVGTWAKQIAGFSKLSYADKILALGFFLHTHRQRDRFATLDINLLFDELNLERPANTSSQMRAMTQGKAKRLLQDTGGFRLLTDARDTVASWLPPIHTPKEILTDLKKLESSITSAQQKVFLHEALVCFANEAYRASIVMAWNLAYHHVTSFIFTNHLAAFNARLKIQYPKESEIKLFTDFEDMKESIFIAVVKGGSLVTSATAKTMKAKLDVRNTAAHPSATIVSPITAEEVITDLVKNILLRSPL